MFNKNKLSAQDKMEKVYFQLLETTHYSKITVSDIIEKAGVSRTTFYRHYVDIFDMHEKVAERLGSAIVNMCLKKILIQGEDIYNMVIEILNSQDKYITLISGKNGSRYFFEAVYRDVMKFVVPALRFLPEETVFRLKFITVATVGVYVKDILDNREHNTDFIEICKNIISLDNIRGGNYGKQS